MKEDVDQWWCTWNRVRDGNEHLVSNCIALFLHYPFKLISDPKTPIKFKNLIWEPITAVPVRDGKRVRLVKQR